MHKVEYITLHQAAKLVPGGTPANCVWRRYRKRVVSRISGAEQFDPKRDASDR